MIEYKDSGGVDCVMVTNQDGSTWSGSKATWEAMQAEQSTPSV